METRSEKKRWRPVTVLIETFGFSPGVASVAAVVIGLVFAFAIVWIVQSAPPRKLVLTSGPEGSSFQRWAESYRKALAAEGITLEVRPSAGAFDNLRRLQAPDSTVDIGFVPSGLIKDDPLHGIVSLGSVSYQPLWIFYRSASPISRLSELAGKRIAVGAPGSGTRSLALALLQANGISGEPTVFVDTDAAAAASDLTAGKLDAVFLMGDSAPQQTLRTLIHAGDIQLFNVTQADAYVRRFTYLNKMVLPQGSFDFGSNLPAQDVVVIGPTVELVARRGLNSAISDLLLDLGKQIHGKAGLLQHRGEFPAPLEHDIPLSDDALRYYKSGTGFFYRTLHSFWLASLMNRLLVAIVPLALVLIPAIRYLPTAYRLSIQLRLYRCYRPLLRIERESVGPLSRDRAQELLARLDELEESVRRLKVPASFAERYYTLRSYLAFVRDRLQLRAPGDAAPPSG